MRAVVLEKGLGLSQSGTQASTNGILLSTDRTGEVACSIVAHPSLA
jgi:hypothetical protein